MQRKDKTNKTKIIIASSLMLTFLILFQFCFSFFEGMKGRVAGEATDSVDVTVNVISSISIDSPSNIDLSPDIEETGTATGSVTWNVKTNNSDGWKLELSADTNPAMQDGANSFANYTEVVSSTPEAWLVDSADSEFGFNASGDYAESKFSGSKYMGFNGLTKTQVASRAAPSSGEGDDTTINFKVEVGSSHNQPLGTYSATITATASTL